MIICPICGSQTEETARISMCCLKKCPTGHFSEFHTYMGSEYTIGSIDICSRDEDYRERFKEACESHPDYDLKKIQRAIVSHVQNELADIEEYVSLNVSGACLDGMFTSNELRRIANGIDRIADGLKE